MNLFIRKLVADHSHLMVQIGFLFDALDRLHSNGFNQDDFSIIKRVIDYLNSELKIHNKLEEDHLFTRSGSINHLKFIINRLKAEHRIMWDKLEILNNEMKQYEIEQTAINFSRFYQIAISLIDLIREHIIKENDEYFPGLEKILKSPDINELNQLILIFNKYYQPKSE